MEKDTDDKKLDFIRYLLKEITNCVTDGDDFDFDEIQKRCKEFDIDYEQEYCQP